MRAYFDSMCGLVPCRIIAVADWTQKMGTDARIEITRTVGPYKRGEYLTTRLSRLCPRDKVRRRKYSTVILPFDWKDYSPYKRGEFGA